MRNSRPSRYAHQAVAARRDENRPPARDERMCVAGSRRVVYVRWFRCVPGLRRGLGAQFG